MFVLTTTIFFNYLLLNTYYLIFTYYLLPIFFTYYLLPNTYYLFSKPSHSSFDKRC